MRVIMANPGRALSDEDAFELMEHEQPVAAEHDLLVRVEAISVNPIDTKMRQSLLDNPSILGWDAAGTVDAVGGSVTRFKPGDRVYYAGDIKRPGSNAEYQLVDERIVGHCPEKLSLAQAAAMPLTTITAWESLFDRLRINADRDAGKSILIIGAAGGVGSIAIQLARVVAGLTVIATASRPESSDWCKSMGADHVVSHREDLRKQFQQQSLPAPDYILCLNDTDAYYPVMAELVAPQGMICALVSTQQSQDLNLLKSKSVGLVWEFMFTRSSYATIDLEQQHLLLEQVAGLLDEGKLRTTLQHELGAMSTETLRQAHDRLLSGTTIGKIVLQGFE